MSRARSTISSERLDDYVRDAAEAIAGVWPKQPQVGIILGTGLGHFVEEIEAECVLPYEQVPHFPRSTAPGHHGQLTLGSVHGVPVVTMEGRFHLYEGYHPAEIILPVRVMQRLGIEILIISNASGGLNPRLSVGDVVIIDDHVNLMFTGPIGLTGALPRPTALYDEQLIRVATTAGAAAGFRITRGTYVAVAGPNYETRAEYRCYRRIGDVIGMSTVPEALVAAACGLRVLALSTVTNVCNPDALMPTDGAAVACAAAEAEWKLRTIVLAILDTVVVNPTPENAERA